MSLQNIVIGVIAVVALVLGGFALTRESAPLGATPGGDFTNPVIFLSDIMRSNAVASSSQGSQTVGAAEFRRWSAASTVAFSPGLVAGATITLPASSTVPDLVPKAGDTKTFCVRNATTTTNVAVTLAGSTGINLVVASSSATALGSKVLLTGKVGCITLVRQPATATTFDIDALLTIFN
jgi:hypothetical protein